MKREKRKLMKLYHHHVVCCIQERGIKKMKKKKKETWIKKKNVKDRESITASSFPSRSGKSRHFPKPISFFPFRSKIQFENLSTEIRNINSLSTLLLTFYYYYYFLFYSSSTSSATVTAVKITSNIKTEENKRNILEETV